MKNKTQHNERNVQKRGKRWQSCLLVIVGCLLLVSSLVVPCFADYNNGSFDPVVSTIPAETLNLTGNVTVDLSGWYRLEFSSYRLTAEQVTSLGITDGTPLTSLFAPGTAYFGFYEGGSLEAWEIEQLILRLNLDGSAYLVGTRPGGLNPMSFEGYIWVRNYPLNNVYNSNAARGAWSLFSFETVRYEGGTDAFYPDDATTIWGQVMVWITNTLASIQSVFYLNGSLTFLGTLAVIGVSIGIAFLIIGVVTRFFQLRG